MSGNVPINVAVGHEALAGFGRWQGGIGMVGTQFVRDGCLSPISCYWGDTVDTVDTIGRRSLEVSTLCNLERSTPPIHFYLYVKNIPPMQPDPGYKVQSMPLVGSNSINQRQLIDGT